VAEAFLFWSLDILAKTQQLKCPPLSKTHQHVVAQRGFAATGLYVIPGGADHRFSWSASGKMTDDERRSSVPPEIVAARKEAKI
jgi:hypothetical protein